MTYSSASLPETPNGLWIPIHSAVLLRAASAWNPQTLQTALQESLRGTLTASTLGIAVPLRNCRWPYSSTLSPAPSRSCLRFAPQPLSANSYFSLTTAPSSCNFFKSPLHPSSPQPPPSISPAFTTPLSALPMPVLPALSMAARRSEAPNHRPSPPIGKPHRLFSQVISAPSPNLSPLSLANTLPSAATAQPFARPWFTRGRPQARPPQQKHLPANPILLPQEGAWQVSPSERHIKPLRLHMTPLRPAKEDCSLLLLKFRYMPRR